MGSRRHKKKTRPDPLPAEALDVGVTKRSSVSLPMIVAGLTVVGGLVTYGLDRWAESYRAEARKLRHEVVQLRAIVARLEELHELKRGQLEVYEREMRNQRALLEAERASRLGASTPKDGK